MALVEDDDTVEALAANGADDPLDIGILPGRSWCRDNLRDAHRFDALIASAIQVDPVWFWKNLRARYAAQ